MTSSNQDDEFWDDDDSAELLPSLTLEELERRRKCAELWKLFSEVNTTINCMKIVEELHRVCSELREGFLVFAYRALFSDAMSSLMRVLDEHKDALSLWRLDKKTIELVCRKRKIDLLRIRSFSKKLKMARNKLLFHIDRRHAAEPDRLWSELDIKYREIDAVSRDLALIISEILCTEYNFPANLSRYDARDVEPIIESLHQANLGNFTKRSD